VGAASRAYFFFFPPFDRTVSVTVVFGLRRAVAGFTNLPVMADRLTL
jgi:hypothetical protein